MKKYLLFISLAIFTLTILAFRQESALHAQNRPEYSLDVISENASSLPNEAKDAILMALNQRWTGPIPQDELFYLTSMRKESTWLLADLYFKDSLYSTTDSIDSPLSNSFMMLAVLDQSNTWIAAFSDEPHTADLAGSITNAELDFNAKTTLFKYFPSQYKTTSADVDYKFPWSSTGTPFFFSGYRTTNTSPCTNNTAWHGAKAFHNGKSCHGLDFAPQLSPEVKNASILSPVTGYVSGLCKNTGNLKQAAISIKAANSEEIIGLYHLDKGTIPSNINLGSFIKQGDSLGQMVEGNVDERNTKCPLVSVGTHLHLVAPEKPFNIDGYTFTDKDTVIYKGTSYTMNEYQNKILVPSKGVDACTPPSVGDWTITKTCNITSSIQLNGSILVNSGGELILSENVSLDMNLKDQKVLIRDGGRLLIKTGSRIF